MKITRRSPRIRIGNTTYTFGKNGVSRSTKIAKGIRVRTSANGHQSVGGTFLFWRWSQDLDELGRKKTPEEIKQIREQRKNELSPWLLIAHPFVFFDHLLRRKSNPQNNQGSLPQSSGGATPQLQNNKNQQTPITQQIPQTQQQSQAKNEIAFSTSVSIYKETNNSLLKVTEGIAILESDRLIVKANVTKDILYKDILDVYVEKGKVFISSKTRNIPLILELSNTQYFLTTLQEKIRQAK